MPARCGHRGCNTRPSYGVKGTKKREYCSRHAREGMVNLSSKRCGHPGCSNISSFGMEDTKKREFCSHHAREGMVDVVRKRCGHQGCSMQASFGMEESRKREFCSHHAREGMVDVGRKRCGHQGCSTQPSFGVKGTKKAERCAQHAREGMVDVRSRGCGHPGCTANALFCVQGTPKPAFCLKHAAEGMVDLRNMRIRGAAKRSRGDASFVPLDVGAELRTVQDLRGVIETLQERLPKTLDARGMSLLLQVAARLDGRLGLVEERIARAGRPLPHRLLEPKEECVAGLETEVQAQQAADESEAQLSHVGAQQAADENEAQRSHEAKVKEEVPSQEDGPVVLRKGQPPASRGHEVKRDLLVLVKRGVQLLRQLEEGPPEGRRLDKEEPAGVEGLQSGEGCSRTEGSRPDDEHLAALEHELSLLQEPQAVAQDSLARMQVGDEGGTGHSPDAGRELEQPDSGGAAARVVAPSSQQQQQQQQQQQRQQQPGGVALLAGAGAGAGAGRDRRVDEQAASGRSNDRAFPAPMIPASTAEIAAIGGTSCDEESVSSTTSGTTPAAGAVAAAAAIVAADIAAAIAVATAGSSDTHAGEGISRQHADWRGSEASGRSNDRAFPAPMIPASTAEIAAIGGTSCDEESVSSTTSGTTPTADDNAAGAAAAAAAISAAIAAAATGSSDTHAGEGISRQHADWRGIETQERFTDQARATMKETKEASSSKRGAMASETTARDSSHGTAKRARTSSFDNAADNSPDRSADGKEETKGSHPRRWSSEEDERLRASVDKHQGTNWKEIANEVQSRNHVQCLQRWKKVLTPGLVKGQWTTEEDQLLVSVVNEGHKNWGTLSARIPGRTSKQCRERWCHHLDPRIVKGQWTAAEDAIIVSMQRRIGNKWAQIAQRLDGRTENATKIRWKILERDLKKEGEERDKSPRGPSSRQTTDARLRCLAAQAAASVMSKTSNPEGAIGIPTDPAEARRDHGERSEDATGLPKALPSTNQKRKRAARSVNTNGGSGQEPNSGAAVAGGKGPTSGGNRPQQDGHNGGRRGWLDGEDERLKEAVEKLGEKSWREVARHVRTRNHIQCQQRWKKALRPGLVKGAWSVEEDDKLVALIGQGFSDWTELAANTGRTAKQCRERWMHHLDPSLRHVSWTAEEDELLITLEARLGKKWAAIAREIPGRTEHAVKGRFKTLSRERDLDRLAGSLSRQAGKGTVGRQPGSPKSPGRFGAPDPSAALGKRRGVARIVSGRAVTSSAPPGNGSCAAGVAAAAAAAAAGGRDFAEEAAAWGAAAAAAAAGAGAGDYMETSMRPPHQPPPVPQQVRPQQQSLANAQQMLLSHSLGAQDPPATMTAPSAAAMAAAAAGANDVGDASIARLLSVSSVNTDPSLSRLLSISSLKTDPSLSDVYYGYTRRNNPASRSNSSSGVVPDTSSLARKQSSVVEPRLPVAELGAEEGPPMLPGQKMGPRVFDAQPSQAVGEEASLVNRIDYSDLASILMDGGFDACKDGVESASEAVTLGEDPYSDYSLSADDHIIMGYRPISSSTTTPQGSGLPQQLMPRQNASFHGPPLADAAGPSSDFSDVLPASVFGGGADDPSDPYYF